jgi:hypothetical protein
VPAAERHHQGRDGEGDQDQRGQRDEGPHPPWRYRLQDPGELVLRAPSAPPDQQRQHTGQDQARRDDKGSATDEGHRIGAGRQHPGGGKAGDPARRRAQGSENQQDDRTGHA